MGQIDDILERLDRACSPVLKSAMAANEACLSILGDLPSEGDPERAALIAVIIQDRIEQTKSAVSGAFKDTEKAKKEAITKILAGIGPQQKEFEFDMPVWDAKDAPTSQQ